MISGNILYEEFDRESLLLDLKTNRPYVLNEMAAVVFKLMRKQMDDSGIAQALCEAFEVTKEQAFEDVGFFRKDLLEKGILETPVLPDARRSDDGIAER